MYLFCSSILATLLLVVPGSNSTPWSEKKTSWSSYQPAAVTYSAGASPAQHYVLSYGSSSDGAYRIAGGSKDDSSDSGETRTISYKFASPAVAYAAAPAVAAPAAVVQSQVSYVAPAVTTKHSSSHSSVYHYQQAAPAPAPAPIAYFAPSSSASGAYVSAKKHKKQKVTYNLSTASRYGAASYEKSDHLEAHRKAVEEHQRAHAEALRRLDEARRLHKAAGGGDSDSDSGEKRAYGTPQKVKYVQVAAAPAVTHSVYTGPQVSRAETKALHADAIAKQRVLIAQQEAINAAGPAKMKMPTYKQEWAGNDSSDDDSKSGETYYYHPAPVVHVKPAVQKTYYAAAPVVPAVQEVTYQYYQQKPYDGPLVSRAETEYLHRDAIAKQQAIIRQQAALVSGVRSAGADDSSGSGEDAQTKAADDAQARQDQANEQALLARQEAEVQAQTLLAKQQGEQAKISGTIEGAWRGDDSGEGSSSGVYVSYGQKAAASSDDDSNSGEARKQYFVPVYEPAQVGYAAYQPVAHSATIYKQASQEVYTGPKVTREETERLHADAIAKQRAIIAQHEAFIARQRSALETRYSYQQKHYAKADSSDSDSAESGGKGGYYAAHYYTAPTPVAPATVNVIGPKVTNYLSGYSPAAFYAGAKQTSYVVPSSSGGVYRAGGSSDDDSSESQVYKLKESAQLAQQDAEVRKQIEIAKAQGAAAAAEGAYYRSSSKDSGEKTYVSTAYVAKPAVVQNPGQYVYYRYARPTFGYYVEQPATVQKQVVVQHHQPAPVVAVSHHHTYQQPQVQHQYVSAAVPTTVRAKIGKSDSQEDTW